MLKRLVIRTAVAVLVVCALPDIAMAHPDQTGSGGFAAGLAHPLGGLDHVLAMLAVGWLAAYSGGRARWCFPLAFVSGMLVGAVLGLMGIALPGAELGVAISVVVLGLALAVPVRLSVARLAALAVLVAVAHGYAHAVEVPVAAKAGTYVLGFMLATVALIALGESIGAALLRIERDGAWSWSRISGWALASSGMCLLLV